MSKKNWIIGIVVVLLVIIAINAPTIVATFSYISQEPELAVSEYSISGDKIVINLSEIDDLAEVGSAVTIIDDSLPSYLLIAKIGNEDYRVVSSECPHRGHAIAYIHEDSLFKCSSLGGESFDIDGNYKSGLAEENLPNYNFSISNNVMTIDLAS